ncbi:MAG: aminotransferase class V-fold PLP-dependent enzyme [Phycisphaerales bacterium]|nr:aminotransferase class V-fold PLP-dependent enzyme [Phycisphaerales bacterium]
MNPNLTYLDNASTSWPKAPAVGPAMLEAINSPAGNPGRGQHRVSKRAGEATLHLREAIAKLIGAPHARPHLPLQRLHRLPQRRHRRPALDRERAAPIPAPCRHDRPRTQRRPAAPQAPGTRRLL